MELAKIPWVYVSVTRRKIHSHLFAFFFPSFLFHLFLSFFLLYLFSELSFTIQIPPLNVQSQFCKLCNVSFPYIPSTSEAALHGFSAASPLIPWTIEDIFGHSWSVLVLQFLIFVSFADPHSPDSFSITGILPWAPLTDSLE